MLFSLLPTLFSSALLYACRGQGEPSNTSLRSADPPANEIWLWQDQVTAAKLVVEPLTAQPVGGLVVTSGRVTFDDLKVAHVMSPVTGRVVRIEAQPGQRVRKGDTLAVIESPDMGSAFSDVEKAQADFTSAEKDFKRQKELFDVHAGSQRDLEAAQGNYSKAKAELERAKKKASLLRAGGANHGSQSYTLRAPIGGEVIARNVNPGTEVQGQYTGGTVVELFTIGELDTVWVMADLFEMDLAGSSREPNVWSRWLPIRRAYSRAWLIGFRTPSIQPRARPRFAASWTTPTARSSPRCMPRRRWKWISSGRSRFHAARSCIWEIRPWFLSIWVRPAMGGCVSSAGRFR